MKINFPIRVFSKADEIRSNPNRREKSKRFAITGVIFSLVAFGLCFAGGYVFRLESALVIFTLVIGLALIIAGAVSLLNALLRVILQFTLNFKLFSWINLVVFLASVAGCVIVILHYIQ